MNIPAVIGRYEVRGLLGEGGMATVLEGWDPVLHRTLAIKLVDKTKLEQETKDEALSRFKREAQAAARLTHANVVQVYEYGEEGDFCFIAMEHVAGKPLTAYLSEGLKSELQRVRDIIGQLLDALAYSHAQGVIHRDIKPGNLLVTREGNIKVTDFGIARIETSNVTQHGHMLGTPSYMSPEQYLGETPDGRADLFAAGVLLYELLTGVKPFAGESSGQIMNKILYETAVDPSRLNPLLPPAVDWVVQRALAKAPQDRFDNAREFSEALFNAIPDQLGDEASPRASAGAPASSPSAPGMLSSARKLRSLARSSDATVPSDAISELSPLNEAVMTVQRARILFVDDEERILTALKTIFRGRYHVLTAANGKEALDFISKFKIPVIVSDQRMPGMLGVELLRRARDISPDSVRILLTGYSDLASIVGSINDGEVYRFISKPWDNQELQQVVGEAVAIGQQLLERNRPRQAPPPKIDGAILLLEQKPGLHDALGKLLGSSYELVCVSDIDQALAELEAREIALFITDIDADFDNYLILFNLLKRKYPQILVLVVTSASDSEMVIHLINEAQIYRFLNKPVNLGLLQQHLSSAITRYAEYQSSPELLERHKVKDTPKAETSSFAQGLLERLRSFKNRLAAAGR
ncbi:MAG TPA: response regulator [Burkholderiales bacterium]|nr:response regulator [Burkholderiales bacterium]